MANDEMGFTDDNTPVNYREKSIGELQGMLHTLDSKKAEYKQWKADINAVVDAIVEKAGRGFHWQSPDGLVWQVEKCTGKFIHFPDNTYDRTRDLSRGEKKGMSMTRARELGPYVVEGK